MKRTHAPSYANSRKSMFLSKKRCSDPVDKTSCFLTPLPLYHRCITTTSGVKHLQGLASYCHFVYKTLVLAFPVLPRYNHLPSLHSYRLRLSFLYSILISFNRCFQCHLAWPYAVTFLMFPFYPHISEEHFYFLSDDNR